MSLSDVERLVDPDKPANRRSEMVSISIYFSRRSYKRWCETMPTSSLSWFFLLALDRFLDEIEELPRDAVARICRLLADDLSHKRVGPILKKNIRT